MSRFHKIARLAAASAALAAPLAFAADTGSIAVSATVSGICKLTALPAMTFTLDPSSAGNGTASSGVVYKCTKGTAPVSFSVGGSTTGTYTSGATSALGALAGTGTNTDVIPYSVAWTAPTTAGSGLGTSITGVTVTLSGTILNANYVNVTADTYSKSLAIVINN